MACPQGRVSADRNTTLRLFADSGGFCQRPSCSTNIFLDYVDGNRHIAEIAHIFAASDEGPRADPSLSRSERGAYTNLILLCPSCHATVDKAPEAFPDSMILDWKQGHKDRIASVIGVRVYSSRTETSTAIEPALEENRSIFNDYGPHLEYRFDPESEVADTWRRKVLSRVLPNNRNILEIIDANRKHLTEVERHSLERFRQHVNDLENRHLNDGAVSAGAQFPENFDGILTG